MRIYNVKKKLNYITITFFYLVFMCGLFGIILSCHIEKYDNVIKSIPVLVHSVNNLTISAMLFICVLLIIMIFFLLIFLLLIPKYSKILKQVNKAVNNQKKSAHHGDLTTREITETILNLLTQRKNNGEDNV